MKNTTDSELAWLAGLLEGEGSFFLGRNVARGKVYYSPRIVVNMTDKDIIDRVSNMFETSTYKIPKSSTIKDERKQAWRAQINGVKAALWMVELLPFMGERRSAKIEETLELYGEIEDSKSRRNSNASESAKVRWEKFGTRNGRLVDAVLKCEVCSLNFNYPAEISREQIPWRSSLEASMASGSGLMCEKCHHPT